MMALGNYDGAAMMVKRAGGFFYKSRAARFIIS